MEFSAVFPNNQDLLYCELSYMTELKALMPKSADSETKNSKTVKTVNLWECSFNSQYFSSLSFSNYRINFGSPSLIKLTSTERPCERPQERSQTRDWTWESLGREVETLPLSNPTPLWNRLDILLLQCQMFSSSQLNAVIFWLNFNATINVILLLST